jgi:hypothetical protein
VPAQVLAHTPFSVKFTSGMCKLGENSEISREICISAGIPCIYIVIPAIVIHMGRSVY